MYVDMMWTLNCPYTLYTMYPYIYPINIYGYNIIHDVDLQMSLSSVHDASLNLSYITMWLHDVDVKMSLSSVHDTSLNLSYIKKLCGYIHDVHIKISLSCIHDASLHLSYMWIRNVDLRHVPTLYKL